MVRFSVNLDYTAFRATVARGLPGWLVEPLRLVRERMIASFSFPKSGRPGPFRRRSARGEPPARQTGRLAGSISQPGMVTDTAARMLVAAPYAAYLNDAAGKLNRPFVEPAITHVLPKFRPAGVA